jgi:hypothetical protein
MRRPIFSQADLAAIREARKPECEVCGDAATREDPCPACGRGGFGPLDDVDGPVLVKHRSVGLSTQMGKPMCGRDTTVACGSPGYCVEHGCQL